MRWSDRTRCVLPSVGKLPVACVVDATEGQQIMSGADAEQFARLAVELHEQPGVPETVDLVLTYAVGAVGADSACVMLLRRGGREIEIAGATEPAAERADRLELETGEGPCLDAARDNADSAVIADTRIDQRWPVWCKRVAADLGIRSVLSVQLGTPSDRIGALNLYAGDPGRFDTDDLAVAHVLARHAAVALARDREHANLWRAIDARKLIGQAQGILMERFDLDADRAFAVLRRYSQDNNLKLRDVAQRLIDARRLPDDPRDAGPTATARGPAPTGRRRW
jgi:GAF domain-containing protein